MVQITPVTRSTSKGFAEDAEAQSETSEKSKSHVFPSTRFLMAMLMCLGFVSLSVSTSNLGVSMVCMVKPMNETAALVHDLETLESILNDSTPCERKKLLQEQDAITRALLEARKGDDVEVKSCHAANQLSWSSTEQGVIFAAQNVGSLMMLLTGWQADRLNGKWAVTAGLLLIVASNILIPLLAHTSVWLVFALRTFTGMGDAFLFPSTSSMITRWFPPKERPFAIGLATGGRQIGALLIIPLAGWLCSTRGKYGGWPAIFYLSAAIGSVILVIWMILSADKPAKHMCVSEAEKEYIARKIEEESMGKRNQRPPPPWRSIFASVPLYAAIAAIICHEYPLVIVLQLLPKYFHDVQRLPSTTNGLVSALPIAILWISKTLSSSLSSVLTARKTGHFVFGKTPMVKSFNLVASLGLGLCMGVVPFIDNVALSVTLLCLASAFAGLHTPGCQTALVQIAPAYTGILTGIAFSLVACVSVLNKLISNYLLAHSTRHEWIIVFMISAVIATLPVIFFTLWGSADRQPWATAKSTEAGDPSHSSSAASLAKYSMYLSHELTIG